MLDNSNIGGEEIIRLKIQLQTNPKKRHGEGKMERTEVKDYDLYLNGHYIRRATQVIFGDGHIIIFMEKMGKKVAIKQAIELNGKEVER